MIRRMVWLLLLGWLVVAVLLGPIVGRLMAWRSKRLSGSLDERPAAPVDSTL